MILQASAKALIFLKSKHGGLVVGGLHATGFMIYRTDTGAWSAPCFITLNRIEIGAVAGYETAHVLMAGFTRNGVAELASGEGHQTLGTDVTFQLWPFGGSSGPDDYASLDVSSDWVTAAAGQGFLFDFALAGGKLSVDKEKNKEVYGDIGEDSSNVIYGKVPRPEELSPLYHKVKEVSARTFN